MTNVTPPGDRPDGFHDHFSAVAGDYARHRPTYPSALFDWLATLPANREHAWDCATGSGQAARELGKHFGRVTATDASTQQLAKAAPAENVEYRVATAEESGLADASVDLVTVAQAVHWFDLERFWPEVRRVLVDGGLVAVWSYELFTVNDAVDAVVWRLYRDVVGEHWPPQRKMVETGYRDLWFPFDEVEVPELEMVAEWDLERVMGYLRTWSASKRWAEAHGGRDPVRMVREDLVRAWRRGGGGGREKVV
ncbi:MAG TPA: class I SAM-dependent methyltransferase, partial [Thermoanaerobaculia bacterium]|nr:class I SAM-dependent methyltransferase [Thermoanaerobaculia bacterium]